MKKTMRLWDIVFLNITAIIGLRWIPIAAGYGASAIILWVLAAVLFFIPLGLIAAELATTWPEEGGIYVWVKEAYGEKPGFLVSWFYWINSFFYAPGLLTFLAVMIASLIDPGLEKHRFFICCVVFGLLWSITLINLKGMQVIKVLTKFGGALGILLPGLIIVVLGFASVFFWHRPIPTSYSLSHWLPNFSSKSNIVFLSTLMFSMSGIELAPILAGETENPQKTFFKSTLISAVFIVAIYIIGTMAMTFIIAPEKIGAASGIVDALRIVTDELHIPIIAALVTVLIIGSTIGAASVWLVVPTKMFLESCKDGILPEKFVKFNKNNMPANAMVVQAIIITIIIVGTSLLPSVNVFYETLVIMSTVTYFIPYIFMFAAFFKLRKKFPDKIRPYRAPGGKIGAWIISLIGLAAVWLAIILPFIVPPQDASAAKDLATYRLELVGGVMLFTLVGQAIYMRHVRRKRKK